MKAIFLLLSFMAFSAYGNLHLAPPDFETNQGRAIFVDFKHVHYELVYDLKKMKAHVYTRIEFEAKSSGRPIFDLIPTPSQISLNGRPTQARLHSLPGKSSEVRVLEESVGPGTHILTMENRIKKNLRFNPFIRTVTHAFWIRDLHERMFLEQYVPSNLEFDQYAMTMDVKFKGAKKIRQDIYTNGQVERVDSHHYRIKFPAYFTAACPYFHITIRNRMNRLDFTYTSVNGRPIPITVYSPLRLRTKRFKAETIKVMKELERDYGPWAHPSFVAFGTIAGSGGMEHAGAAATSLAALDHEMLHSYFAKGVMPANGNSGWIDEAIAAWRDRGYPRLPEPGFSSSNLGAHSPYRRSTDSRAYSIGSSFLAYIDWKLQHAGGLKAFLRGYFETYKHQMITTEHFKQNLEFWSGLDLSDDFNRYIWGKD